MEVVGPSGADTSAPRAIALNDEQGAIAVGVADKGDGAAVTRPRGLAVGGRSGRFRPGHTADTRTAQRSQVQVPAIGEYQVQAVGSPGGMEVERIRSARRSQSPLVAAISSHRVNLPPRRAHPSQERDPVTIRRPRWAGIGPDAGAVGQGSTAAAVDADGDNAAIGDQY